MLKFDDVSFPINISILLPSLKVGGAERLVFEELCFLKNDARFVFELHLVFEEGPFYQRVASLGIPVLVWGAPHKSFRMLDTYIKIINHLRRSRCDILHTHLLNQIGPVIGKFGGVKAVTTVHNDRQYNLFERFVLGNSDLVFACGNQVANNISRFIPSSKVAILKNAIHSPVCKDVKRSEVLKKYQIEQHAMLTVSFGRLTKLKGFDLLIQAFKRVVAEMPNAVLLIGGDGEEKGNLVEAVKSSELSGNVRLLGLVDDVHELLAVCDLYVNSSTSEGLPMTLLEAMSHGKPMVATHVGGNAEVVHDQITGLLVEQNDQLGLSQAILYLLKDEALRKKMGEASHALFQSEYRIDRHCAALAGYYSRVMQGCQLSIDKVVLPPK
jgi:glycosyltransferase involved in cell wall biosynthesis